jgi:polysaccharide export outer membrane protein
MKPIAMRLTLALLVAIGAWSALSRSASAADEYRLGAGDSVRITAYNNPDLTTEARIAEDGSISFPLLGRVTLAGMTKPAAEQQLAKLLTDGGFLRQAAITIAITEYRSQQVSVLGAVPRPGKYPITSAASAMDVLAEAGGIAPNGSWVVRLIRRDAKGNTEQRDVDLSRAVGASGANADFGVQHGDVIFVAAQPVFYIYGEVQKPGAYPLQRDMTVRQAIAAGGGLTLRGTERGVRVGRRNKSGTIEMRKVKLADPLQADDVVQVKESWF